ncbi:NAD-binding protein [Cellulomonas sp. APG4]|uniref:FAD-dependent oxidoreductase n=1 Tax=Cellulomonas sp. APG4 TaxID=1538656 RepID=UPI00137AFB81|nr:NAD-binding protein [Cellulomonas sp. APG4]
MPTESSSPRAVVVGGGIAGLASAVALRRAGWRVTVLERAADVREVGAGVAMSRNAVAAFRGLGFTDDDVAALGRPTWAAGTWDEHGRRLLTVPATPQVRSAVSLVGVHRRRLHGALLDAARDHGVEMIPGIAVTEVDPGEADGAPAVVAGHVAELVVGADGMRSAVRAAVYPGHRPVYSGYSSWRAVVRAPQVPDALVQYWGPHAEFGLMPVADDETYWYGYVAMPERTVLTDELGTARERFAGWPAPVRDVLAVTPREAVLRHDVHHLPGGLPRYAVGRVVMVGDAAHGFLPTMGQGAATALEDGLSVGLLIGAPVADGGRLAPALEGFDRVRRPRCRGLARAALASARVGAHLGGGVPQTLRRGLMRLVPSAALSRGAQGAMGWTPPAPASPVR